MSGVKSWFFVSCIAARAVDQDSSAATSVGLSRETTNLRRVGVEDGDDALEDIAVVALVDARLLAGLDGDLVDEGLRSDLVRDCGRRPCPGRTRSGRPPRAAPAPAAAAAASAAPPPPPPRPPPPPAPPRVDTSEPGFA